MKALALSAVLFAGTLNGGDAPVLVTQEQPGKSPMALLLSLAPLNETEVFAVPGLRDYVCDDVSFNALSVRRRRGKGGFAAIEIRGALWVRPSYDRDVDLSFVLTNGERVLRRQERRRLDSEEGKVTEFKEVVALPEPAASFSAMTLSLTMVVREGEGV